MGSPSVTEASSNDGTVRDQIWRRFPGDEWDAYDALPERIRARMREHAYDAWAFNTLVVWRHYRQKHASSARAERSVLRFLENCEREERAAFASAQGSKTAHDAARASILRYSHSILERPKHVDDRQALVINQV